MKESTLVTVLGRDTEAQHGIVNPPTWRASTILSPTVEAFRARRYGEPGSYGRYGTPTTAALASLTLLLPSAWLAYRLPEPGRTAFGR